MRLTKNQIIAIVAIVVPAIIAGIAIYVNWVTQPPPTPDFQISVDPMGGSVLKGGTTQTTITVRSINGYDYDVSLSPSGNPTGMIVNPIPPSDNPKPVYTSNVIITVPSNFPEGDYPIVIKGTGQDGKEHTCTYTITVKPNGPTPTATPTPTPTATPTFSLTITSPLNGAVVPEWNSVEGYANKESPAGEHPYIVVEYAGQWWPQTAELTLSYSSATQRYGFSSIARVGIENDTGKVFVLRAVLVDSAINQRFQNWFQIGQATGNWPGILMTEINQLGRSAPYDYVTLTRR